MKANESLSREEVAPEPGPVLRIHSPSDGSWVGEVPVSSGAEVRAAVDRCRRVQRGWASLDPGDRARRLRSLRRTVAARMDEIATLVVRETGKPEVEALAEVNMVLELLRYYERRAPSLLRPRRGGRAWFVWKRARLFRDPFGVIGVISPWNHPFILAADPVFTALFAGNGAVLKPSERAPFTGRLIEGLCREGGLPDGLVAVVQGGAAAGEALVRSGVDRLHFTGGPRAGRRVMELAAEGLVPLTLELGAKDAALVLEDADLRRAARGIAWGAFSNAGQICLSTDRVYVAEEVYDVFVRHLLTAVGDLRAGSGGEIDVGPMTVPEQLTMIEERLAEAVAGGARILAGGGRTDPASNVLEPTVLADPPPDSRIALDGTFGPVLVLFRVRDEEEAVRRIADGPDRLFASVWTGDLARGEAVAHRLGGGGASVNDTMSHYSMPALPTGGAGQSGFGRIRGDEGLLELTRTRVLVTDRGILSRDPWWFPYHERSVRLMRAVGEIRGTGGRRGWFRALAFLLGRESR